MKGVEKKKLKKSRSFRLETVYWDLLKAVVEKNGDSMSNETTALQVAIYELAQKDLDKNQIKEILKKFYDETNSIRS